MRIRALRLAALPLLLLCLHLAATLCAAAEAPASAVEAPPAAAEAPPAAAEAPPGAAAARTPASGTSLILNPLDLDAGSLRAFEAFLCVLSVLFTLNFFYGVRTNLLRARAVADVLDGALEPQFASVGVAGGQGKRLVRDGAAMYWYYATGRLRTSGLAVAVALRPRQDLFATAGALLRGATSESMIAYAPVDANMDPLSVLLIRRREIARWRDVRDGVALRAAKRLAGEVADYPALDGDFVVMAEHRDCVPAVINGRVRAALREVAHALKSVHVTDFGADWEPQCAMAKKIVRLEVALPERESERREVVSKCAVLVCLLVDAAVAARLSSAAKKKAIELRREVLAEEEKAKQKVRREEIAAEKEAKKKEKEAAVARMSREKQAKYDEKMRKKAFKDRLKKVTVKG